MKPSVKVFATLSLSAAVGKKIQTMEVGEDRKALGSSLYDAGYEATGKYPYPALSAKKIGQIVDAVEGLIASPTEPQVILSMLIAGLVDIHAHVKPERQEILDPVIYCAQACLDSYPGEIDHDEAYNRYCMWANTKQ